MISPSCNFSEFLASIKDMAPSEMIIKTVHEATAAERLFYKIPSTARESSGSPASFLYANLLKDLMRYIRYGVMSPQLKNLDSSIKRQLASFGMPRC